MVTVASQGMTSPSGVNVTVTSGGMANPMLFKLGPNGGGAIMLELGGNANDIAPQTDIALPGGTWGLGLLQTTWHPFGRTQLFLEVQQQLKHR